MNATSTDGTSKDGSGRVLDETPVASLDDYVAAGGCGGLEAARRLGSKGVIDEISASGLRGRGGAGFPTGRKWETVAGLGAGVVPKTVVVNGAEGEPGTFKDRAILRANPYRVLEGALIAALAIGGADRVVVALKGSFGRERARVEQAVREMQDAGWAEGVVDLEVFSGPEEYLFGEETALLEVLNGRPPFPRIAPPYRHGADEIGYDTPSSATTEMAERSGDTSAPPTLVNNVETLAHASTILARGADWFRSLGTEDSPGTIVCTVSGDTRRAGVIEVPMGTPLREVIERAGGGAPDGATLMMVLPGTANALVPASAFDTPLTHEAFQAIGSGIGSCGFLVFDDQHDPVAIAEGVARFLAVESCGQCTPCKGDGLDLAALLTEVRSGTASDDDVVGIHGKLANVTEGARCALAQQQQSVVGSVLANFDGDVRSHLGGGHRAVEPVLIAPLVDIDDDGAAEIDRRHADKQPDWTYEATWNGEWPANEIDVRADAADRSNRADRSKRPS